MINCSNMILAMQSTSYIKDCRPIMYLWLTSGCWIITLGLIAIFILIVYLLVLRGKKS